MSGGSEGAEASVRSSGEWALQAIFFTVVLRTRVLPTLGMWLIPWLQSWEEFTLAVLRRISGGLGQDVG